MKKRFVLFPFALGLVMLLAFACGGQQQAVLFESEDDLPGKRVVVQTGSVYDLEMTEREDIQLFRCNTATDCIASLVSGKVDVFKDDEVILSPADQRRQGIQLVVRGKESFPCGFAFRKEDVALVEQCNAFLAEIRASGLYQEVYDRWMKMESAEQPHIPEDIPVYHEGIPIRVAASTSTAPLGYQVGVGQWEGFEIELLMRFAASVMRPLEIKPYDAAAGPAALQTGRTDIWFGCIFITEERQEQFLFSDPYYECHSAYFIKRENDSAGSGWEAFKRSFHKNLVEDNRWRFIVDGLWETLVLAFWSLVLGTVLAGVVCWMKLSRYKWLRKICKIYISLMHGLPMLVLLMVMFYVVLADTSLNATVIAIISFSMVFSAYVGEVFASAIESVGKGQTEAGIALGFTPVQTFIYVVLPQAVHRILPLYKAEAVSLFKNTSIVGYIAIQDLTRAGDVIRSRTFDAFFPLIVVSVIYFILAFLLGKGLDLLVKNKQS